MPTTVINMAPIFLDGTTHEGGGGLIRDSVSFAAILNKPLNIFNIRANRTGRGGLRKEHTVAIDTMAFLSTADIQGNEEASRTLSFAPYSGTSKYAPRETLDVEVQGSAAIFMLALLPYILFSKISPAGSFSQNVPEEGITIKIRAGTICVKAPSFWTVREVILPTLHAIGLGQNVSIEPDYGQGWHTEYVTTPGLLTVWIKPLQEPLPAFKLSHRGSIVQITATAHAPSEDLDIFRSILTRELNDALKDKCHNLLHASKKPQDGSRRRSIDVAVRMLASNLPGQYHLLLTARAEDPPGYLGYEQIYPQRHGFPEFSKEQSEDILLYLTRVCIRGLGDELSHGHAIDDHLEDMLAIYQTLANGFSSVAPMESGLKGTENPLKAPEPQYFVDTATLHRETSRWVAHQMAGVEWILEAGCMGCYGLGLGGLQENTF